MAVEDDQPLDEVVWSSPEIVQEMGFIHTNTVLPYFSRSPFFDQTSNNAVIMNQATYNPNMLPIVATRAAFEAHLRSMAGVEFVVSHDPSQNDTVREHSGIWVIRKQTRRKRPDAEDEIVPRSAYFVVGDRIYMAPTIGGILESRLLSTVTKLTKLLNTASSLPLFSPAVGHSYYPPAKKAIVTRESGSTRAPSKESTPTRDGSVKPFANGLDASQASVTSRSPKRQGHSGDARNLLQQTLQLAERYGGEYMDTMPLQGEPGSFIMKKGAANPVNGTSVGLGTASKSGVAANNTAVSTPVPTGSPAVNRPGAPAVPPLQTSFVEEKAKRKGSFEEKSPTSPITPGGTKRRKKSKIGGVSGGKITPTSATT